MKEYRIVTNGDSFRIQEKAKTLFRRRDEWIFIRSLHSPMSSRVATFDNLIEAENALEEIKRIDRLRTEPWRPI